MEDAPPRRDPHRAHSTPGRPSKAPPPRSPLTKGLPRQLLVRGRGADAGEAARGGRGALLPGAAVGRGQAGTHGRARGCCWGCRVRASTGGSTHGRGRKRRVRARLRVRPKKNDLHHRGPSPHRLRLRLLGRGPGRPVALRGRGSPPGGGPGPVVGRGKEEPPREGAFSFSHPHPTSRSTSSSFSFISRRPSPAGWRPSPPTPSWATWQG